MHKDKLEILQIMLFDPDRNSASVTKLAMQQAAVQLCRHCRGEAEALEAHGASPFDVILADLTGESLEPGTAFIQAIRALPKPKGNPPRIVALLGQGTEDALHLAIALGADSAWVKPISANSLRNHLEQLTATRLPYFQAEGYYGPDRRRLPDEQDYQGPEKRSGS